MKTQNAIVAAVDLGPCTRAVVAHAVNSARLTGANERLHAGDSLVFSGTKQQLRAAIELIKSPPGRS